MVSDRIPRSSGGAGQSGGAGRSRRAVVRDVMIGTTLLVTAMAISLAFGWEGVAARRTDLLPTGWLIGMVQYEQARGAPLMLELHGRVARGKMNDEHLSHLLDLCVLGDHSSPPGSPAWRQRYGRLVQHWQFPDQRPWEERRRLYRIPATIRTTTAPVWPLDAPTTVHLRLREWWPTETACRLRVEIPGRAAPMVIYRIPREGGRAAFAVDIPPPLPEVTHVTLRVHIDHQCVDDWIDGPSVGNFRVEELDSSRWQVGQTIDVELPVLARVRLGAALQPVVDETVDAMIEEVFRAGILRWSAGGGRVAMQFAPQVTADDRLDDMAIGVEVELLEGEAVRRRSRIWWLVTGGQPSTAAWDPPLEHREGIARLLALPIGDPGLDAWSLRITGVPALALRAFGSSDEAAGAMTLPARYWSGQINVPITVIDREDRPPLRFWSVDQSNEP